MEYKNNNLSPLPFYGSIDRQNARRWWMYGRIYPLFCGRKLLPFQIRTGVSYASQYIANPQVELYKIVNGQSVYLGSVPALADMIRTENVGGELYIYYSATASIIDDLFNHNGQYYIKLVIGTPPSAVLEYYSEVFTYVVNTSDYLKVEWWDVEDFVTDAGTILYHNDYKNFLYLQAEVAKPEYIFEEEGEDRDGYFFPIKQISEKRYKFNFLASEYLCDVMRLIRLSDYVRITNNGVTYWADSFLITPEWEREGDVASVAAQFETNTVCKKLGRGYIVPDAGDFNEDYNNDYSK